MGIGGGREGGGGGLGFKDGCWWGRGKGGCRVQGRNTSEEEDNSEMIAKSDLF